MTEHHKIAETLRDRLLALYPEHIEIIDESHLHAGHAGSSGGAHFRVVVISALFTGKSTPERHRMVIHAVGDLMQGPIHALSVVTQCPEEKPAH